VPWYANKSNKRTLSPSQNKMLQMKNRVSP
jgi:hypothetical protein